MELEQMEDCAGVFSASESHEAVESDHFSEQILGGSSHYPGKDREKGRNQDEIFSSSTVNNLSVQGHKRPRMENETFSF